MQCDVTDPSQVEAAFAQVESALGAVEVLVANAGITRDTLVLQDVGRGLGHGNRHQPDRGVPGGAAGRPADDPRRFGRIVFISSVVGQLGSAGQVNYAASKSGLVGMARSLARELGSRGVTANVVAPGFIETDMTSELGEDLVKKYAEQIPLGRLGSVDDVAAAVEFLSSDAAGYITGALLPVDGGLGMGH